MGKTRLQRREPADFNLNMFCLNYPMHRKLTWRQKTTRDVTPSHLWVFQLEALVHFPEATVASEHRPRLVQHGDLTKEGETTDVEIKHLQSRSQRTDSDPIQSHCLVLMINTRRDDKTHEPLRSESRTENVSLKSRDLKCCLFFELNCCSALQTLKILQSIFVTFPVK